MYSCEELKQAKLLAAARVGHKNALLSHLALGLGTLQSMARQQEGVTKGITVQVATIDMHTRTHTHTQTPQ